MQSNNSFSLNIQPLDVNHASFDLSLVPQDVWQLILIYGHYSVTNTVLRLSKALTAKVWTFHCEKLVKVLKSDERTSDEWLKSASERMQRALSDEHGMLRGLKSTLEGWDSLLVGETVFCKLFEGVESPQRVDILLDATPYCKVEGGKYLLEERLSHFGEAMFGGWKPSHSSSEAECFQAMKAFRRALSFRQNPALHFNFVFVKLEKEETLEACYWQQMPEELTKCSFNGRQTRCSNGISKQQAIQKAVEKLPKSEPIQRINLRCSIFHLESLLSEMRQAEGKEKKG